MSETRRGLEWQDDGLCAQVDPELFFPALGGSTLPAKRICAGCDVRVKCLDYALNTLVEGWNERGRPMDGVWGGTSPEERAILRGAGKTNPQFRARVLALHGREVAA